MGGRSDQLLKQCAALARVRQSIPTIFIFDRDQEDIVKKVEDPKGGYREWGNNVFSFALPIPAHRHGHTAICIEFYYSDDELRTPDSSGRRMFVSSEFNPSSGRHLSNPDLSIGNKGKLGSNAVSRIIDSEVYDEHSQNVALSKADFAKNIIAETSAFASFQFEEFRSVLTIVDQIIEHSNKRDLPFGGLEEFLDSLKTLDAAGQFCSIVEACIRVCKLAAITFSATTLRFYEQRILDASGADAKKARPINKTLLEGFTHPSLTDAYDLARQSYHLVDSTAPSVVVSLQEIMDGTHALGALGQLLDQLELFFPPPPRRGRSVNKSQITKPVLAYVIPELAKYEGRAAELLDLASRPDALREGDSSIWRAALSTLVDMFAPLRSLQYRIRNIERTSSDGSDFLVLLTTYRDGVVSLEEFKQAYRDLKDDRLETYELQLGANKGDASLELYPFLIIKADRLYYYNRTKPDGYEYGSVFGSTVYFVPTKRKFSHASLRATIAADLQGLFWTQVTPSVSSSGVRANIPAHGPIVGRKEQIDTIMDEVIQIPNQNAIVHGPGGVGKTALLIELSKRLSEEGPALFKNIIWVSAKRDYCDPTLDVIEPGAPQFECLDNILASILDFYDMEDATAYTRDDQKGLVLESFRAEPTLLIVDNFESVKPVAQDEIIRFFNLDVKRALRDKPANFKLIVTSRERLPLGVYPFGLRGLDKHASIELMQRLYEPYRRSGQQQLSVEQLDALYEATSGIPLMMKHCYGQIYEFNRPVNVVLRGLSAAPNKVVEFSFAEIFALLKEDELQRHTMLLLELIGRPLMLRHAVDILGAREQDVADRLAKLVNFQCVNRSSTGIDERYSVSDDVQFFTSRLVLEYSNDAAKIKKQIATLTIDKRMDYTQEEFRSATVFEEYLRKRSYLSAEGFIKKRLKENPGSVLLNYHYARYLKEIKRKTEDAIDTLESIRAPSGNDPQVLRLLIAYNIAREFPNFEQAHTYARELEDIASDDVQMRFELAQFYVAWSTALKMKFELDPLKEILRQQKYKELADIAIKLLKDDARNTHEWHHLLAQSYYDKWDYDAALRHIEQAIKALPKKSHLENPYWRLKNEILKKKVGYGAHRRV